jgi:oligopeptide/dipeptide ABC transporter ATP-binding protein
VTALLEIEHLAVRFLSEGEAVHAVTDLDLIVPEGACLGIVGESGCGKSVSMLAVMGLLPDHARVTGSIRFGGQDIGPGGEPCPRGHGISMVFQDSMSSLDPLMRVGNQVAESVRHRAGGSWRAARAEAVEHLDRVGLRDPGRVARQYPHELSGGMRQRVAIAGALAAHPRLLIADEATTGLDVTVQAQIIDLLADLRENDGLTVVFISHDLGAVADLCELVAVVYGGRVAESGPTAPVIADPRHPYTRALLDSYPRLGSDSERLVAIAGTPATPVPVDVDPGCPFRPRCASQVAACSDEVPVVPVADDRLVTCVSPGARA